MKTLKKFYSIDEAVWALDHCVSRSTMYKLVHAKQIPTVQIGPRVFITGGWIAKQLSLAEKAEVQKDAAR